MAVTSLRDEQQPERGQRDDEHDRDHFRPAWSPGTAGIGWTLTDDFPVGGDRFAAPR
jgi:hypothetical protein